MFASAPRRPAEFAKAADGAAAVELALVSPLLIMLVIGFIQLGWILHCASSVRWALEGASRSLLINPELTAGDLQTEMLADLSGLTNAADLSVSVTPDVSAKMLVVESRYVAHLSVPFVPVGDLTFKNTVTVPDLD